MERMIKVERRLCAALVGFVIGLAAQNGGQSSTAQAMTRGSAITELFGGSTSGKVVAHDERSSYAKGGKKINGKGRNRRNRRARPKTRWQMAEDAQEARDMRNEEPIPDTEKDLEDYMMRLITRICQINRNLEETNARLGQIPPPDPEVDQATKDALEKELNRLRRIKNRARARMGLPPDGSPPLFDPDLDPRNPANHFPEENGNDNGNKGKKGKGKGKDGQKNEDGEDPSSNPDPIPYRSVTEEGVIFLGGTEVGYLPSFMSLTCGSNLEMSASPGAVATTPVSTFSGSFNGLVILKNPLPVQTEVVASLIGPNNEVISGISIMVPALSSRTVVMTPPIQTSGHLMLDVGNSSGLPVEVGGSMGTAGVFLLQ